MIAKPPVPILLPISILFVCLGNICRSPLAEGPFRAVAEECRRGHRFGIDSAGTGGWQAGSAPDPRSIAARQGIDISGQKARRVRPSDFHDLDLILGMDRSNVEQLKRLSPPDAQGRVHLFLDYAPGRDDDVPEPYYGGPEAFADVYRMIREASEALADATSSGSRVKSSLARPTPRKA